MSIVLCMSLNEPSTFSNRAHSRPAPSFRRRTATFGVLLLIAVYKFVGAATCRRISALPTASSLTVRLILSAASSASARVVTIALAQASTARAAESFTNRRVVVGRNIFWGRSRWVGWVGQGDIRSSLSPIPPATNAVTDGSQVLPSGRSHFINLLGI